LTPQPTDTAALYLLTPEQVQFITAAFKAVPLQGTAETIRPILSMMDTIQVSLNNPVDHVKPS
jgi:hypothetical protein